MKTLRKLLKDIEQKKPIDIHLLQRILFKYDIFDGSLINFIQGTSLDKNRFLVETIEPQLLESIRNYTKHENKDRISGAHQNLSHSHSVDSSYLLCRRGTEHPYVVCFDSHGIVTSEKPINIGVSAVVIENLTNFMLIEKTIQFLTHHTVLRNECLSSTLFIYGNGNQINSRLHKPFLAAFDALYHHLDIDLGGLKISSNMIDSLPNAKHVFIAPDDLNVRLSSVVKKLTHKQLQAIVEIANKHSQLQSVALSMREYRCGIEQESFLHEYL